MPSQQDPRPAPMRAEPQPLAACPPAVLAHKDILLTDVDDTLTCRGRLAASTLAAMEALAGAGIAVIPVTGGCSGWADHMARAWPVAAVIAEGGAVALRRAGGGLERLYWAPRETLARNQAQVLAVAGELQQAYGIVPAGDQDFRIADVALDHAQDVGPLPAADVQAVIAALQERGIRARASSIHVNAWIGDFDKEAMARRCLARWFGVDGQARHRRVLFIGDAPNDEALFAALPDTVAVANIAPHLLGLHARPRWITAASHGEGFEELASTLLEARRPGR
ncbi:hypothetical protein QWY84_06710 [Aquisalimonas lutea]|uniref:hypothetical protein n=1 Tax=Aquisalimonas lutea TaxID=1327750 RepID=UPI0025B526D0|nr:hypothetical protein [Aquisalimonas lutea]MDN3517291.1 hypothetical protein [Aquisalimonas lutea]